jgi:hypothetical protein
MLCYSRFLGEGRELTRAQLIKIANDLEYYSNIYPIFIRVLLDIESDTLTQVGINN